MTAEEALPSSSARDSRFISVARLAVLATALIPIVLLPHYFFPFVTTRNVVFRWLVELAVASLVMSGVRRLRNLHLGADDVLPWFFAYFGALSLSAVFGLSPWHSVFGDFERMGGVFAWLHLLLFYFVLRAVMREPDWRRFFFLILIVADLIVVWGSLEFLPASIRNPLFQTSLSAGSTVGNPGLLAPYLLLALAPAAFLFSSERGRFARGFCLVSALIMLFGVAGSRNRSSELGLLAGLAFGALVLIVISEDRRTMIRRYLPRVLLLLSLSVIAWLAIVIRAPAVADRLGGRWEAFLTSPIDYARTIEWKIALRGFHDRPVFGYGPENHQIVASHHFDPNIYGVLGEGVFDRTHNLWLELLATTGVAGTATMIGIWLAVALTIRRGLRQKALSVFEASMISGVLMAYAVYLTFWFFDLNSVLIWVALLAFLSFRVDGRLDVATPPLHRSVRRPLVWAMTILVVLAAYLQGAVPLRAARDLSDAAEPGPFDARLASFEKVFNSSAPQTMHTFPLYYRFLRNAVPEISQSSANLFVRKELDLALQRGVIEAERSVSRNSADDRSYVDAARFYSLAGLYYSDGRYLNRARMDLLKAIQISPNRPDSRILLSGLYSSVGDTARGLAQLDSAMRVAPKFPFGYLYAARLMIKRGGADSSASLLLAAMARGSVPAEQAMTEIVDSLRSEGHDGKAAILIEQYLEKRYGPLSLWHKSPSVGHANAFLRNLANMLPILYLRSGDVPHALRAADAFSFMTSAARATAAQFTSNVKSGEKSKWQSLPVLFEAAASSTGAQ